METVTRFVDRQAGSLSVASTPGADAARTLSATASFLLSEDGRKASLLSGGDGRSLQQITLQVPANRLHLVSVDKQGVARLKLRPRFEMDTTGIVRIDTAPVYDLPPTVDELYRAAAKNHELEAAYFSQRTAVRTTRAADDSARRQSVAEAFWPTRACGQRHTRPRLRKPATWSPIAEACCSTCRSIRASPKMCRRLPSIPRDRRAYRSRSGGSDRAGRPARGEKQFIASGSTPTEPRKRRRGTHPSPADGRSDRANQ